MKALLPAAVRDPAAAVRAAVLRSTDRPPSARPSDGFTEGRAAGGAMVPFPSKAAAAASASSAEPAAEAPLETDDDDELLDDDDDSDVGENLPGAQTQAAHAHAD